MSLKRGYLGVLRRLSGSARRRRFAHVERVIAALAAERTPVRILDAGGVAAYWQPLDPALRALVEITVLNRSEEQLETPTGYFREHRQGLLEGAPEDLAIEGRFGDACAMPEHDDRSFDLVHSNSVIQHVGGHDRRVAYAREIRRVGRAYCVQSPNVWFPLEPNYGVPFAQFLPSATRAGKLFRKGFGYHPRTDTYEMALDISQHIEMGDYTMVRELFPEAAIVRERSLLMTKSFLAISAPGYSR